MEKTKEATLEQHIADELKDADIEPTPDNIQTVRETLLENLEEQITSTISDLKDHDIFE